MSVKIERLNQCHINDVSEIENICFTEPWSKKALEDLLTCNYAVYFAAIDDISKKAVGYCGMYVSFEIGAINNIGVLPQYRNCGIASKLLYSLYDYSLMNGIDILTLEVRKSNVPAIKLYEKFGFKKVGERKNYYKKPTEDGIIYNFEIKSINSTNN